MMKKDISYDLIRCLAMLLIIVWHFNTTSVDLNSNVTYFYDNTFSVNFGRVGVALFFILSGALLILHYDKSFSLKKFYTKRFLRIYIPQWLTYSIVFAIYYIIYPEWLKEHSLTGILISFMGGDCFGELLYNKGINIYWLVGEWFTTVIIFIYAIFPFLRWAFIYKYKMGFLLLTVLFILNLKVEFLTSGGGWFSFSNGIFCFWIGMCLEKYKIYLRKYNAFPLVSLLICLIILYLRPNEFLGLLYLPTFIFSVSLFIILMRCPLSCSFIRYICKYNFELYLVHHRVYILLLPLFLNLNNTFAESLLIFVGLFIFICMIAEKIQFLTNHIYNFVDK